MNTHTRINAPTSIALADDNIVVSARHLAKLCERIAASKSPRDFLATNDGVAFLNCVFAMTEIGGVYDLAADIRHEFAVEDERQGVS